MAIPRITTASLHVRTLVNGCVFLLLVTGFVQVWLLDGMAVPYRIAGGSMAETLLGVHREVVCADCGYRFVCGAGVLPTATRAACPNCGYAANELQSLPDVDADRVLIDRAAFSIRSPRRWEVVAFRQSQSADNILIKRVVGLPGESIEIREGDVYADGHLQRKTIVQQRALAVLVHDANFEPTRKPTPPARWRGETPVSRWKSAQGRFSHVPGSDDEPIDWLVYHHWRRSTGESSPGTEKGTVPFSSNEDWNRPLVLDSPITDISSYNPWQTRREEDVHPVHDLMLSFRLGTTSKRGSLHVRLSDGPTDFETRLRFDADQVSYQVRQAFQPDSEEVSYQVRQAFQPDSDEVRLESLTYKPALVEVSLIDRQFLLAIDGVTLVTRPYDRPESAAAVSPCALAIGAQGLEVTVSDLRVYRDVYYTQPIGAPLPSETRESGILGKGEYYVLGDNSPASTDSRTWPAHGAIDGKLLVGKPLAAIPSVSYSFFERWHFQVPNLVEIRYIR